MNLPPFVAASAAGQSHPEVQSPAVLKSASLVGSVPSIGLGCVTFGREIDRATSFRLLDHAGAHGITHFDTAAAYGSGTSESILGEWLEAQSTAGGAPTLSTKILPPYSPALIEKSVAACRQRLRRETIDVLYLHRWDAAVDRPDVLRALDRWVRQGVVKELGASNFTSAQLAATLAHQHRLGLAPFRALQNVHNFAVRGFDERAWPLCAEARIASVGYSPLGAGFLTGKHRDRVDPGSRFDLVPAHQEIYFTPDSRRRLACLEAIAARSGYSTTQLALAWAFHQHPLTSVLIGGRTTAHIDQALQARAFADEAVLRELDAEP